MWRLRGSPPAITLLATLLSGAAPATAESFDCLIEPGRVVQIGSPVAGILAIVSVERGDLVTAGTPLARIESGVEEATVALLRERAADTAAIAAQQARAGFARARFERAEVLRTRGAIAEEAHQQLRAERDIAEAELAVAETSRRLAALELARAEAELARHSLHSPIDGVVTARALSEGAFVTPEREVLAIAALDPLHVEVFLPAALYPQLRAGQPATVIPDLPGAAPRTAHVAVIDRVFDATSNSFGVRLLLENPDSTLPAGLRCTLRFSADLP